MVEPKIFIEDVNYFYGYFKFLPNITLDVPSCSVTVFFGPAGGGKTTLLRLINRLNDMVENTRMTGRVLLDGQNIYDPGTHIATLRRRVGMVFALPLPLPGTVRENVTYGLKLAGLRDRYRLEECLERSLTQAALWDEIKDRLDSPATALSGGQQQRLWHSQKPRAGARSAPARRTNLRSGPDFNAKGRGIPSATQTALYDHYSSAQHTAGSQSGGPGGFHSHGRSDRIPSRYGDIHNASGQADGRLHYGPFRIASKRIDGKSQGRKA